MKSSNLTFNNSAPPVRPEVFRAVYDADIKSSKILQDILEDFYIRMSKDILIGFFFSGKDLKHIAHQQAAFILKAIGVDPSYKGRGPASAHTDLPPILEGHFNRRLVILSEVLKDHGLSEQTIRVWLGFEKQFFKVVVK